MRDRAASDSGLGAALVCLLAGVVSLPLIAVGKTAFVVSLMLSLVSLGLATYVLLEQRGVVRHLMAWLGVVGALAGPALFILSFVSQE